MKGYTRRLFEAIVNETNVGVGDETLSPFLQVTIEGVPACAKLAEGHRRMGIADGKIVERW